jgi:uncharacterized iron-regulated membrane protein
MKLLHKIIFWSHLLAGVIAGAVIFIMSATGAILMYEHQLVEYAERDVREVVPPGAGAQRLSLDEMVAKARERNPDAWPTGVVLRNDPAAFHRRRLRPRRRNLRQSIYRSGDGQRL